MMSGTMLPVAFTVGTTFLLLSFGNLLAPVLIALLVAYLLDGLADILVRAGLPRLPALGGLFGLFVCALAAALLYGIPMLWSQTVAALTSIPVLLQRLNDLVVTLVSAYPDLLDGTDALELMASLRQDLGGRVQTLLGLLPASAEMLLNIGIYLVLVPLTVFFLLFDKNRILAWFGRMVPAHPVLQRLWPRLVDRLGGYVRGKAYEILIVSAVATVAFYAMGLNWPMLLGTITGVSALIPILGAVVAAVPVVLVAYAQWGLDLQVVWALALYAIIQVADGNLLQPLLMAETVGMHPVALIVAVLICGGVWGIWGLLLAVPAAIAVHVLLDTLVEYRE